MAHGILQTCGVVLWKIESYNYYDINAAMSSPVCGDDAQTSVFMEAL